MKFLPLVLVTAMLPVAAGVAQQPAGAAGAESTGEFLKRMKPVLDKEAAVEKINAEIPKMAVTRLNFDNTPLTAALDKLNDLIRAHNAHRDVVQIPFLRIAPLYIHGTPEYEKMRHDEPQLPDFALDKIPITFRLININLDQAIDYVTKLGSAMTDIEPDGIWLSPLSPDEPVMENRVYFIPSSICSTKEEAGKWINKDLTAYNVGGASWDFDKKSHLLTLQQSDIYVREFEKWYARELFRHGFKAAAE